MAQKRISRFPLNEKFSRLSGHVPNYGDPDVILSLSDKLFYFQMAESTSVFYNLTIPRLLLPPVSFSLWRTLLLSPRGIRGDLPSPPPAGGLLCHVTALPSPPPHAWVWGITCHWTAKLKTSSYWPILTLQLLLYCTDSV